ncbi:MAG: GPR endopeptidase, partial [Pseudoflavonifractor sp.]
TYVTILLDGLARREEDAFGRAARAVGAELADLLHLSPADTALVVGLGNRAITPDAIGPVSADHTMVTRHLVERVPQHFGGFRPVAALKTGVLGTTGMESGELVAAVVKKLRPACVVAIDALASRSLHRVCRTIQLADTGIVPGSGIGNARAALSRETLGVPVIAIGVPTVVDAATLCCDVLAEAGRADFDPALLQGAQGVIVTPKEIDSQVADIAKVIGFGVNLALQTGLTVADVEGFLS